MIYSIRIEESRIGFLFVEAKSEKEAEMLAEKAYEHDKYSAEEEIFDWEDDYETEMVISPIRQSGRKKNESVAECLCRLFYKTDIPSSISPDKKNGEKDDV